MPRYYCDYCDTYLTHDSPSVRKQHNAGYKHKANVRTYYQQYEAQLSQSLLDQRLREHIGAFRPPIGPYPPPLRPGMPMLPIPGQFQPGQPPLMPGMRPPPVLPRPLPGMPGYGVAPPMSQAAPPPGAPLPPGQMNGLQRPINALPPPPPMIPGNGGPPPMFAPPTYQGNISLPPTSGAADATSDPATNAQPNESNQ